MFKFWLSYLSLLTIINPVLGNCNFNSCTQVINNYVDTKTKQETVTNINQAKKLPIIPIVDFNQLSLFANAFYQTKASEVNFNDLYSVIGNNILFQVTSQAIYDSFASIDQLRSINFIDDNYSDTVDQFLADNFNKVNMFYNNDLGLIKIQLVLKPNTTVRYIINENYSSVNKPITSLNKKVYSANDYIELSIINFKNKYSLLINDSKTISAKNISLSKYNASDLTTEVIINELMQFEDSNILLSDNKLLVTNYDKKLFLSLYQPEVTILSSSWSGINCFCKLSLNLFNQLETYNNYQILRETNNSYLHPIRTDVIYFSISDLKNNISCIQNQTNYDISTNLNFATKTASEFNSNFRSNILNLINYANDRVELKNPLFTTNLSRREFNMLQFNITPGIINDIDGVIDNCELKISLPINQTNNNVIYEEKSYKFSLYNFKKNIQIQVNDNKSFDVSKSNNLNNITSSNFKIDDFFKYLVSYQSTNLDSNYYLISTNVNEQLFRTVIKDIKIENIKNETGELDLRLEFNDIVSINQTNQLSYHLYGFKRFINIHQNLKTINHTKLSFLKPFDQSLQDNHLINDQQRIDQIKRLIISNYFELFLFGTDTSIDSKVFSINCEQNYFNTKLVDWNQTKVSIFSNLGLINVKIFFKDNNGISINNQIMDPNTNYIEFNINDYYKDYHSSLIKEEIIVDYHSLNIKQANEITNDFIYKNFIGFNDQIVSNALITTTLNQSEFSKYFVNGLIIDFSALNTLGLAAIKINLANDFIEDVNNLYIVINGFSVNSKETLYKVNKQQIDISSNGLYNQFNSDQVTLEQALSFIGYNFIPDQNKTIIFSCSKFIFNKYLLKNASLSANNDKLTMNLVLNENFIPKDLNITSFNLSYELVGFKYSNNWWIIFISIVIPIVIISLLIVLLVLYWKRKKKVKELKNEKQIL